ncbi:MAG: DUF6379 domain-containing protein [Lactovum sp.]
MLEKECIQSKGFKNILENNKSVGFQFAVRLMYYRGLWLSQLRPFTVIVDGVLIAQEELLYEFEGQKYTSEEMETVSEIQWNVLKPVIIHVKQKEGLKEGYHEIEVDYRFSSSYMPPEMDEVLSYGTKDKRKLLLVS